ncbi:MAG: TlpA disulfide reductase family protein [Flavobacteriaceae bacterium]
MKKLIVGLAVLSLWSCKKDVSKAPVTQNKELKSGTYRAVLDVKDQKELPFVFKVDEAKQVSVINAEETITVDDVVVQGDSVHMTMPVFDAKLTAFITAKGNLKGYYTKGPRYIKVPFEAMHDVHFRYPTIEKSHHPIAGNWEVTFSPNTKDSYKAKGVFKDGPDNKITGTFLTETGDYRFLEGALDEERLKLSCFDGAHAFLFDGIVKNDSITSGMFYSGNHYKEPWVAVRNETFELTDPNALTYLKEGYSGIEFTFPDLNGQQVSLTDERFKDKAVVIQIMGSWCPNCLDESKYLSQFYKNQKPDEVEFVALAFENAKTIEKVTKNLNRLKERIGIDYPILIAQTGSASKTLAAEKLPMLNHILSYPTTIFIDKKGVVRKIHTGFSGPATGEKYEKFKHEFERFVETLSKE